MARGTCPREMKTYVHTKTCTWIFTVVLFTTVKKKKSGKNPDIAPQMNVYPSTCTRLPTGAAAWWPVTQPRRSAASGPGWGTWKHGADWTKLLKGASVLCETLKALETGSEFEGAGMGMGLWGTGAKRSERSLGVKKCPGIWWWCWWWWLHNPWVVTPAEPYTWTEWVSWYVSCI